MDIEQVLRTLRKFIGENDQKTAAKKLGVSPSYLSDVLTGRREPGKKMLNALGMKRVVRYGKK